MYGTGDLDDLGVKVALDKEGPPLDPDAELPAAGATEPVVREYLARRFPALADAPLKEGRCCRYELSADSNFIAARHPEHERTWIVGGGSGHGFKHGPALAERIADALRGGEPLPERFGLGAPRRRPLVPDRGLRRTLTNQGPSWTVSPPPSSSASPAAVNQRL